MLIEYRWPGNIRQLKNITEQISIIEKTRNISAETLAKYIPHPQNNDLPMLYKAGDSGHFSERELLYKVLFDMKKDVNDLKQLVMNLMKNEPANEVLGENSHIIKRLYKDFQDVNDQQEPIIVNTPDKSMDEPIQEPEEVEESLSLAKKEADIIRKALQKYKGKRKNAARELGIAERTLYRKIRDYNIES
jgi:DNA-binding NtrC family response regulator